MSYKNDETYAGLTQDVVYVIQAAKKLAQNVWNSETKNGMLLLIGLRIIMTTRRLTKCIQHEINDLNYLTFHEDAEIRVARGEKQYKCAECDLYRWPRR